MDVAAVDPAHQVGTAHDVSPLVRRPHLHGDVVGLIEVQIVVGLQQGVGELGVGDALFTTLDAAADRVTTQQVIHAEVLAHVTQVIHQGHGPQPVQIVDIQGVGTVHGDQKIVDGAAVAGGVGFGGTGVEQNPLVGLERRIPDLAGGTAHQHHRTVAGSPEPGQQGDGQQVADGERIGGGIKAAVHRPRPGGQMLAQAVGVGGLVDQAPPGEVVKQFGHACDATCRADGPRSPHWS